MSNPAPARLPGSNCALVLSGGGARTAYQVGVLAGLAELRRERVGDAVCPSPFGVIVGTSAGAINAAALAAMADDFNHAVERLSLIWSQFRSGQVFRSDVLGISATGARWLATFGFGWALPRFRMMRPQSLLDNAPLAGLLSSELRLERIGEMIGQGSLRALAVTASSYTNGEHVTFYQSDEPIRPWTRSQRSAARQPIGVRHLLASSAIPFVFPAVPIEMEGRRHWFGDGSMRLMAPLAPAIHLGADRLLVIGCGRFAGEFAASDGVEHEPPSIAQIGGHALSGVFLDALAADLERLERVNRTIALLDQRHSSRIPLRPIEVLSIEPSRSIGEIAAACMRALPTPVRAMLRAVGVGGRDASARGTALASFLLFEAAFTTTLIDLGRRDAQAQRDALIRFFGWPDTHKP